MIRRLFSKDPIEQLLADQERRKAAGKAIGELKLAKKLLPDQPETTPDEAIRQPATVADAPVNAIVINSNPVPVQENAAETTES